MIKVRGPYVAFVDYIGPDKVKRSKDAVFYVTNAFPDITVMTVLVGPDTNEAIL